MVFEINDINFNQHALDTNFTNVVCFWSSDCKHCQILMPLIKKLSEYEIFNKKLRFYKINIDDNTKTADNYNIEATPDLLFFKDGKIIGKTRGAVSEELLMNKLDILVNG